MKGLPKHVTLPLVSAILAWPLPLCAEEASHARASVWAASRSLFEREPMGWDFETVVRVRDFLAALPSELPHLAEKASEQSRMLGITGSLLVLLLFAAIGYALFGQRHFAARIESGLAPSTARLPEATRPWLSALVQVIAAGLLPLALWGLHRLTARLTGYDHPLFILVGSLLLAWARYAVAVTAIRELVRRPLIRISAEHGRYLHRIAAWILFYGVLLSALLDAASAMGMAADVVALARSLFRLSLIGILTVSFARKSAVMALFPDLPNRLYRGFVRGLERVYPIALVLTFATALLAWAGYGRLANVVWTRSWALVGLFLAAVLVHHLIRQGLRHLILTRAPEREGAVSFYRSSERLLDYIGVVVVLVLAFRLSGLGEPLARVAGAPMYSLADRQVSLLTFVEAAIVVAAFVFLGRLLRDYLDFQVYPALEVDEGVAHAVNNFVGYMAILLGSLVALQVVGIGLGSLTVFAGALGIGVGFGLQSLASNVVSGLSLSLGGDLRKGDWVTVGDTVGVIQEVGIHGTRLLTRDAVEYLVPNTNFVSGIIINWTGSTPLVRQHVPIGVSYGSDPERVKAILLEVAAAAPNVEKTPPPDVWLIGFGDSSVDFELLVWINLKKVSDRGVRSDLYFRIFRAFKQAGIEIPFPQREIRIKTETPGGPSSAEGSSGGSA